jgi:hypothetical protein
VDYSKAASVFAFSAQLFPGLNGYASASVYPVKIVLAAVQRLSWVAYCRKLSRVSIRSVGLVTEELAQAVCLLKQ